MVIAWYRLIVNRIFMGPDQQTESIQGLPYRAWWGLLGCAAIMGMIAVVAPYSADISFRPDEPGFVYYWVLPEPTVWTRVAVWLPYVLHQVAIWFLIAMARKERPQYIFGLHAVNLWALGINGFFILLHIIQTKIFYDGLAQDVHELSSMLSVIFMLLLILLMENRRRGLFFGKPVRFMEGVGNVVRRYHGFYISWAIIYTFWYHPIETTSGHLIGTFYMMLLLLQSSLFFTRFHVNRWWTMTLEVFFVFHGAIVAYFIMNDGANSPWSVFLFGGIGIFLITQIHGLGLARRQKWMIAAPLILVTATYYLFVPDEFLGLPRQLAVRYTSVLLLFLILWLIMRPLGMLKHESSAENTSSIG